MTLKKAKRRMVERVHLHCLRWVPWEARHTVESRMWPALVLHYRFDLWRSALREHING
jgi:hypothetical protein